jgi:hypothetical protein
MLMGSYAEYETNLLPQVKGNFNTLFAHGQGEFGVDGV